MHYFCFETQNTVLFNVFPSKALKKSRGREQFLIQKHRRPVPFQGNSLYTFFAPLISETGGVSLMLTQIFIFYLFKDHQHLSFQLLSI